MEHQQPRLIDLPELQQHRFRDWWVDHIDITAPEIEDKARTYGSNSLAEMGRLYARGQGREVDTTEALELGCALYAKGKMERICDAIIRGELPSDDTWHDLMVYAAMAMYIRQEQSWP